MAVKRRSLLVGGVAAALASGGALLFAQMHGFGDAERWAREFDDPAREAWQKPAEVIRALRLAPDAAVADIGSGTGYFAVRLARALPGGRVFGADLEPNMVRYLNERAAREKLANLSSHAASPESPKLPEKVDLVLVVDTYHHIDGRERYFAALRASLEPGGRVAIIDFKPDSPEGPPGFMRIPAGRVKEEMSRAGYRLAEEHAFLPYQYFLVFAPR
ncbi:MAG: class I SAM-dependent methyltransferase [Pseudomonadota bacterium]